MPATANILIFWASFLPQVWDVEDATAVRELLSLREAEPTAVLPVPNPPKEAGKKDAAKRAFSGLRPVLAIATQERSIREVDAVDVSGQAAGPPVAADAAAPGVIKFFSFASGAFAPETLRLHSVRTRSVQALLDAADVRAEEERSSH